MPQRCAGVPWRCGVWKGVQSLMLCAATGTSLPGERKVRHRTVLVKGELVKQTYTLDQPNMHATYRKYFNAVDLFNKASLQPGTLVDTWHTKKAHKRLFAATWAWIETNGMLAYNRQNPHARLTKQQWFKALAEACVNNPFKPHVPKVIHAVEEHGGPVSSCNGSCWVCKKVTKRKCKCGRPVCGLDTRARST